MKRLTKYLAIGAADYNYPADCYSGNDCNDRAAKSAYRQTCVERLAAYEDTGLTPERCAEFARADAEGRYIVMRDAEQEGVARLRELAEADKGGRLVVLPCKVGQRVFALLDTDKHISECEVKQIGLGNKIGFIGLEPIGARGREYGVSLNGFDKSVFLTREEAEKALKTKEG